MSDRALEDIQYEIRKQRAQTEEIAGVFHDQFGKAFDDANAANEQRHQSIQQLMEQMKIGQAMQALQFGFQNNQFGDKTAEMQQLYSALSTRVIEDAKEIVRQNQRGSEFDDMFESQDNSRSLEQVLE